MAIKVVALLALVSGSLASDYLCGQEGGSCSSHGLALPPPGYWPSTYTLNLASNSIASLPRNAFSGYPNVETLYLTRNKLTEIDLEDFSGIPYLRALYLGENSIANIKKAPAGLIMDNLHTLNIQENALSVLDPDLFSFAPNLDYLDVMFNPIVVNANKPILNHEKLRYLSLSYGDSLGESLNLGAQSFVGLPALETVLMASAGIKNVTGAFVSNTKLRSVSLAWNSITQVVQGTFPSESLITELYLNGNPLTKLETSAINKALADGATLYISDTPLACECLYEALFWWAQAKGIIIEGKCNGVNICNFTRRR